MNNTATWLVDIGHVCFRRRGIMLPVAMVLLLLPGPALSSRPALVGAIGMMIALIGQMIRSATIGLVYIIRGGKDHRVYAEGLVTEGIYAHCRNPMYFGNSFLLAGFAVAANSWLFLLGGVPFVVFVHRAIIAAEEDFLRRKFGAEYDAYCARVPRWFPQLRGLGVTFRSMRFDWRRVLISEYAKPLDWVAAIALIIILNFWRAGMLREQMVFAGGMVFVIVARLILWRVALGMKKGGDSAAARAPNR